MLLWLGFGVLAAAVLAIVLRPLLALSGSQSAPVDGSAVFKDQLAEIARDLERGLITAGEAEATRVEISRRLLASAESDGAATPQSASLMPSRLVNLTAMALGLVVPLAAALIYLMNGAPGLPSQTEAMRRELRGYATTVETRLAQNPADGAGWDVVAPLYMRLERFPEAATAFARAATLLGDTTRRLEGFVDASRMANDGRFTSDARAALEKLVKRDPTRGDYRMWLATARQHTGDLAGAEAELDGLLKGGGLAPQWQSMIEARLDEVRALRQGEVMVDRLAQRLKQGGGDLASWERLIRAYMTLGRRDAAIAALGSARTQLGTDAVALAQLTDLARTLGLGS